MLYLRELIYEEKTLDDFDLESENSVFRSFYNILLETPGTRAIDRNAEENITGLLNDACYIFSLAMMLKRPHLKLGNFMDLCNQDDTYLVMTMVYYLLYSYFPDKDKNLNELAISIKKYMDDYSSYNGSVNMDFALEFVNNKELPPASFFNYYRPRRMTHELLNSSEILWIHQLHDCTKNDLKEFVCLWKEPQERNTLINYILNQIKNPATESDLPF